MGVVLPASSLCGGLDYLGGSTPSLFGRLTQVGRFQVRAWAWRQQTATCLSICVNRRNHVNNSPVRLFYHTEQTPRCVEILPCIGERKASERLVQIMPV